MCYFIGIEDLVANALIELVESTGNRTVSFSQLNKYGEAIITRLKKEDMDVTLIFTREKTERFFHDCSNIFSISENDSDIQITLNDNVSTSFLRKKFRVNLSINLLSAFVATETINAMIGDNDEAI